jgi:peptidoglycan/LPS O-acetylase OafA/YrhL
MNYFKPLDGLRGIAVLLVVLFHYDYLAVGWIGVQIFFVISGFLITSILVNDKQLKFDFFLKRFYWRRTLRIFPLYFGYLLVLAAIFLFTQRPHLFGKDWFFLFSYTYNYWWLELPFTGTRAYSHFWSLAVEEQFYIFWPPIVYFLSRQSLRKTIIALVLLCPIIRVLSVMYAQANFPEHPAPWLYAYSPTTSQIDALATGAGLALLQLKQSKFHLPVFVILTIIMLGLGAMNMAPVIAAPWHQLVSEHRPMPLLRVLYTFGFPFDGTNNYQYIWRYTILNFWSAYLIVNLLSGNFVTRIMSNKFLVYTGKLSYGIYVFHYPLVGVAILLGAELSSVSPKGLGAFTLYLCTVYFVAAISFRFFESKFIAWKDLKFTKPKTSVAPESLASELMNPSAAS